MEYDTVERALLSLDPRGKTSESRMLARSDYKETEDYLVYELHPESATADLVGRAGLTDPVLRTIDMAAEAAIREHGKPVMVSTPDWERMVGEKPEKVVESVQNYVEAGKVGTPSPPPGSEILNRLGME